jgi:integrase
MDYEAKLKTGTKTYNGIRDVPISNKLKPYLEEAIRKKKPNKEDLLFYDYVTDTVINTSQVNDYYQRVCAKINLPPNGQHALRHTFATRCIESGIPPVVLKSWLGHKDIHTTLDTYTDVFKSMDIKAVNQFDQYLNNM